MDYPQLITELERLQTEAGLFLFWKGVGELKRRKVDPRREKKKLFDWVTITAAFNRQKGYCPVCRIKMLLFRRAVVGDHIDPNRRVGLNNLDNCAALCGKCNAEKGPLTLTQFAKRNGRTIREFMEVVNGEYQTDQE